MQERDPTLNSIHDRVRNYMGSLFEKKQFHRINDSRVNNFYGFRWYAKRQEKINHLDKIRHKVNGIFHFSDTFQMNFLRFGFQWLESFSLYFNNPKYASQSISREFGKVFTGSSINLGVLLFSNHYAANFARTDSGISIPQFWIASQIIQLVLTPLNVLAVQLISRNPVNTYALYSSITPKRIYFNAMFSLSIGLQNSHDELLKLLSYPTIIMSSILLRQQSAVHQIYKEIAQKGERAFLQENKNVSFLQRYHPASNLLSITAFCLLNFAFPIVLPQSKSKEDYRKYYFEVLNNDEFTMDAKTFD